jgi:hypothetical protein
MEEDFNKTFEHSELVKLSTAKFVQKPKNFHNHFSAKANS